MIVISAFYFDPFGSVIVDDGRGAGSKFYDTSRRVQRSPTLDGMAWIADYGTSQADKIFPIQITQTTKQELQTLRRIVEIHGRAIISTEVGCFLAIPSTLTEDAGRVAVQFLIEDILS